MMVMNNLGSAGECAGLLVESDEDKRNKRDVEED